MTSDVTVVGCILCHTNPRTLTSELCEECFTLRTVAANDDVHNWGTNVDVGDKILVTIDGKMHKATCAGWRTHNGVRHVRTDIMKTIGFYDAPFSDVRIIIGVREILQASELARLQAIIDDIAAHLTVDPERNMFYLKLGGIEYGAFIKPEDYMDDFPFMVILRPIAEMKAAALLASMKPAEDSDKDTP